MRHLWSPHSDYKTTEDLSCCYATFQQCNYLTTWCPRCPQFCCPLCSITSLCSSAVTQRGVAISMCNEWPPPHQENKYNPCIILRPRLMSQSCFPIWKTAGLFCCFFFPDNSLSSEIYCRRKMNIFAAPAIPLARKWKASKLQQNQQTNPCSSLACSILPAPLAALITYLLIFFIWKIYFWRP